jgi:hypothetical protein
MCLGGKSSGINPKVVRGTADVVNCRADVASPLEWPMTVELEKTADDELEALGESGFALAIQLLGRRAGL